MDNFPCWPLVY